MNWMSVAVFAIALAVSPIASAQRPDRYVDPPIVRSFNWFACVGGDDIRANCGKDGRNRMRLIYNAIYSEQVRTYELFLQPDGTAGLGIGVLADQGVVSNLLMFNGGDALKPWSMKRGNRSSVNCAWPVSFSRVSSRGMPAPTGLT